MAIIVVPHVPAFTRKSPSSVPYSHFDPTRTPIQPDFHDTKTVQPPQPSLPFTQKTDLEQFGLLLIFLPAVIVLAYMCGLITNDKTLRG